MDYSATIQSDQRKALLAVLQEKEFSDVTFVVGPNNVEFGAIRALIAAISPVFKAMLFGEMKESELNSNVIIEDIDPHAFQSVIHFAYCNDPAITAANVISVQHICDKYQITRLSVLCEAYFTTCLEPSNLCLLLTDALKIKSDKFINQCQDSLSKFGSDPMTMLKSEGFQKMSLNAMQILLQSDHLMIKEEDLWEYVLQWTKYQNDHNAQIQNNDDEKYNDGANNYQMFLLKTICPFMRFGLMNSKYFVKNVKPHKCLTDAEMTVIFSYQIAADEGCGTFSTKPRLAIQSTILKEDEFETLDEWVRLSRKSKYELLFRGSRDGFAGQTFHNKCDDKGATLCIVQSEAGHVFGGYTEKSWKCTGDHQRDDNAWIYLLRSAKKDAPERWTPTKHPECAIHTGYQSYGPTFGGGYDLYISDGCNNNTSSYSNLGHSYSAKNDGNKLAGSYNFKVIDYEVWQLCK